MISKWTIGWPKLGTPRTKSLVAQSAIRALPCCNKSSRALRALSSRRLARLPGVEGHRCILGLAPADVGDPHRIARLLLIDVCRHILHAAHRLAVHRSDDVPRPGIPASRTAARCQG